MLRLPSIFADAELDFPRTLFGLQGIHGKDGHEFPQTMENSALTRTKPPFNGSSAARKQPAQKGMRGNRSKSPSPISQLFLSSSSA
jgi:hypothetical protein